MKLLFAATALALTLAACSQAPEAAPDTAQSTAAPTSSASEETKPPTSIASPTTAPPTSAVTNLTLKGLGDLKLGQAVPAGSRWAERGGQASDTCRTASSPDYPGVYAIVESGKVRRVTVGQRSTKASSTRRARPLLPSSPPRGIAS